MRYGYTVKFKNEAGTCTHFETRVFDVPSQMVALTRATVEFVESNSRGRKDDMTDEQMNNACVHITPFN